MRAGEASAARGSLGIELATVIAQECPAAPLIEGVAEVDHDLRGRGFSVIGRAVVIEPPSGFNQLGGAGQDGERTVAGDCAVHHAALRQLRKMKRRAL